MDGNCCCLIWWDVTRVIVVVLLLLLGLRPEVPVLHGGRLVAELPLTQVNNYELGVVYVQLCICMLRTRS